VSVRMLGSFVWYTSSTKEQMKVCYAGCVCFPVLLMRIIRAHWSCQRTTAICETKT